jgi:uncharacterized membrane protein YeaQ/YmgE (transglycosylase-associated protein family)
MLAGDAAATIGWDAVGRLAAALHDDVSGATASGADLPAAIAICLAIGASAGWIAARRAGRHGTELWGAVALGVLGALAGPVVLTVLGLGADGPGTNILGAAAGAGLVLPVANPPS